ncbi:hypothetical protein F2Q70_00002763 [Brassica cretica]|uniref:Uncharacterized protein n=1 Tax=Brassica cretica TaxID=69181 RepID=A0A3N6R6P9_BRACR|nr:hypothetical protein F2Q70_00002763 [Brassica cretica]KAF3562478.1 hypothetical protein DY000_02014387 [Brassica cretica]
MDYWSLEIDLVTRRLYEDPRVAEEPGGIQGFYDRSGDSSWNPEGFYPFSEIILRPLRPYGIPEDLCEYHRTVDKASICIDLRVLLIRSFPFPGGRGRSWTGPGKLHSGEPGFFLAGILGTGVPSSRDPEAGVLPGASLRQDIALVILRSRVPLRSEPYSKPGRLSVSPISDRGLVLLGPLILVEEGKLWASDDVLEEELHALIYRG